MIEKLLAECNRPSNMKNAARAGYMAAKRLLQHARQPLPATDDAEPNVQSKGTAVDLHSLIGDLEYAAKTHAHHGTLHTRDGLHAARKALMAAFQAPAVGDATP